MTLATRREMVSSSASSRSKIAPGNSARRSCSNSAPEEPSLTAQTPRWVAPTKAVPKVVEMRLYRISVPVAPRRYAAGVMPRRSRCPLVKPAAGSKSGYKSRCTHCPFLSQCPFQHSESQRLGIGPGRDARHSLEGPPKRERAGSAGGRETIQRHRLGAVVAQDLADPADQLEITPPLRSHCLAAPTAGPESLRLRSGGIPVEPDIPASGPAGGTRRPAVDTGGPHGINEGAVGTTVPRQHGAPGFVGIEHGVIIILPGCKMATWPREGHPFLAGKVEAAGALHAAKLAYVVLGKTIKVGRWSPG